LWDKTGEPDPEIQQLEEILGALRYQPRPLRIPEEIQIRRTRGFFRDLGPRLAIAATIAMLLVGLGLWFALQRLQRRQSGQPTEIARQAPAVTSNPTPAAMPARDDNQKLAVSSSGSDQKLIDVPRRHRVDQSTLARNANRLRDEAVENTQVANAREGAAAKDQLMLALRVASAKWTFAQKKTQSTNPRDLIHNQHKIG
jgi:hypothetical protein